MIASNVSNVRLKEAILRCCQCWSVRHFLLVGSVATALTNLEVVEWPLNFKISYGDGSDFFLLIHLRQLSQARSCGLVGQTTPKFSK